MIVNTFKQLLDSSSRNWILFLFLAEHHPLSQLTSAYICRWLQKLWIHSLLTIQHVWSVHPYLCCVTFAESEPYCHSILFVWLSVIPRRAAYHDWSITTKFGWQVYTCPRTRVSLSGSLSPILWVPERKICKISPISNAYSCHHERDASCHICVQPDSHDACVCRRYLTHWPSCRSTPAPALVATYLVTTIRRRTILPLRNH